MEIIITEISFLKMSLVCLTCDFDFCSLLFIIFCISREIPIIMNVKGLHKVKCLVHDEVTNTVCMPMYEQDPLGILIMVEIVCSNEKHHKRMV